MRVILALAALLLVAAPALAGVWAPRDTGAPVALRGVAVGEAAILAVGDALTVLRSVDGLTWQSTYGGFDGRWEDVGWRGSAEAFAVGQGPGGYAFVGHTTTGGQMWGSRLLFLGDTGESALTSVGFDGFAILASGAFPDGTGFVLRSPDGDEAWPPTLRAPEAIVGVASREGTVLAVGAGGGVFRSADGGLSWESVPAPAGPLRAVSLATPQVGVAVGPGGTLARTADGGATWSVQTLPTGVDLEDVAFATATTGYAVGAGGAVVRTMDGGVTWTPEVSVATSRLWAVDARATLALVRGAYAGEAGLAGAGLDVAV